MCGAEKECGADAVVDIHFRSSGHVEVCLGVGLKEERFWMEILGGGETRLRLNLGFLLWRLRLVVLYFLYQHPIRTVHLFIIHLNRRRSLNWTFELDVDTG